MKRILIVEDEENIRALYKRALSEEGFDVLDASGAFDANEILKKEAVDCVLLDIRMPYISGCALYESIRLLHKETKIIVNSVFPVSEQKKMMGYAHAYHDKSHCISMLLEKINEIFQNKPEESS